MSTTIDFPEEVAGEPLDSELVADAPTEEELDKIKEEEEAGEEEQEEPFEEEETPAV